MSQQFETTGEVIATSAKVLALSMLLTAFLIAVLFAAIFALPLNGASVEILLAPFAVGAIAVVAGYLPAFIGSSAIWLLVSRIGGRGGWSRKTTAYLASMPANVAGVASIFLSIRVLHRIVEGEASPYPFFGDGVLARVMFVGAILSAPIVVKLIVK